MAANELYQDYLLPMKIDVEDVTMQTGLVLKALSNGVDGVFELTSKQVAEIAKTVVPSMTTEKADMLLRKLYATSCVGVILRQGEPVRWHFSMQLGFSSF